MADHKPPRELGADERAVLRTLTQYHRDSIVRKVEDLSDEDARRSPVPSGTSLLWLVKHLCYAEQIWLQVRFAGVDVDLPGPKLEPGDTVAQWVAAYRQTWADVDAIADAASLDDTAVAPGPDGPVELRWILAHLLEEIARHAGHADILRELLDGSTGR